MIIKDPLFRFLEYLPPQDSYYHPLLRFDDFLKSEILDLNNLANITFLIDEKP